MPTPSPADARRPARKTSAKRVPRPKRMQHLRVPVFPAEKATIEDQARRARRSVARYLREVGQGYVLKSVVDFEAVGTLARINGDLGRLGGLLKLWLKRDPRTAAFSSHTIEALLQRIAAQQEELGRVMQAVVRPAAERKF